MPNCVDERNIVFRRRSLEYISFLAGNSKSSCSFVMQVTQQRET